jgi:hypothetical protein
MRTARAGAIVLVLMSFLVGCVLKLPTSSTAGTQPAPPPELQSLPQQVRIVCAADQRIDAAGVNLWELPGTKPSDPNSAYQGNRGELLGTIQGCTEVTATEYRWSEADEVFWVRVRDVNGLAGWLHVDQLDLVNP